MKKEHIKIVLLIFIAIQPLLDIYYLYTFDGINSISTFSPATIIRLLFCLALFIMAYKLIISKKDEKFIMWYIFICITYVLLQFLSNLSTNNYSLIKEIFYIVRMIFPLEILYITYKCDLEESKVEKGISVSALIYIVIMIVTNLTLVAIPSYEFTKHIDANFISWFFDYGNKYEFYQIASKGIFHMANQISATFILILPILFYYFYKKTNLYKFFLILLFILSMLMVDSKTASYGTLIVVLIMPFIYLFFSLIKKEILLNKKTIILNVLIIIFTLFVYSYAPIQRRVTEGEHNQSKITEAKEEMLEAINTYEIDKDIIKLETNMKTYFKNFSIDPKYYDDVYPIDKNVDFWINIVKLPIKKMNETREIQLLITKNIYYENFNLNTFLFGLSFSSSRASEIYIERDIIVHYYTNGIVGLILFICPYLIIACYAIYKIIKNYREKCNLINMCYLFGICITLAASVFSGNVLDELVVTIYLGFMCGILLNNVGGKNEKN